MKSGILFLRFLVLFFIISDRWRLLPWPVRMLEITYKNGSKFTLFSSFILISCSMFICNEKKWFVLGNCKMIFSILQFQAMQRHLWVIFGAKSLKFSKQIPDFTCYSPARISSIDCCQIREFVYSNIYHFFLLVILALLNYRNWKYRRLDEKKRWQTVITNLNYLYGTVNKTSTSKK